MEQTQLNDHVTHDQNFKNWKIQEDLTVLKNWAKTNKEIGVLLNRSNGAIYSRRNYLRNNPNRIKELRTSFPDSEYLKSKTDEQLFLDPGKEKGRRSYTKIDKLDFANFQIPEILSQQFEDNTRMMRGGRVKSYSLREDIFILENADKSNISIAKAIGRTEVALSVKKSKLVRDSKNPNTSIAQAYATYKGISITPQKKVVPQIELSANKLTMPFSGFEVDWANQTITFTLK